MSESHTYLFLKPCGCLSGLAVDVPEMAESIGEMSAGAIKAGGEIKRVPTEAARRWPFKCEIHKNSD